MLAVINERIGGSFTANDVEDVFAFEKMNRTALYRVAKNLADETQKVSVFQLSDEDLNVRKLVELGLVSFEWREKRRATGRRPAAANSFRATFLECAEWKPRRVTDECELFVVFDVDRMSLYKEFVELKIMPLVAQYVIEGLILTCSLESMPVKPCRNARQTWCQLMAKYENTNVSRKVLDFAESSPLDRSERANIPRAIKVYFSLDDTVDLENPWGSCPLLHSGTNFQTPEYSKCLGESDDDDDGSSDTVDDTCFVYSQKNPTIEIPSKLNTEADIVMRGMVNEAKHLFGERTTAAISKRLAIAMALSHPKARIRNVANFYFSVYLPKCASGFEKTRKCPTSHRISLGRDASIVSSDGISRKMAISSYRCLACRDQWCSAAAATSRHHLCHGSKSPVDILIDCGAKNGMSRTLADAVVPDSPKFRTEHCDRGAAVCHNFFCKGVQPVSTPFSSADVRKTKLVLYGKVVDVVNVNYSRSAPVSTRKRIFYHANDDKPATAPFKEIVYHECDRGQIELHAEKNRVTASSVGNDKKWWKTMVDLTADFDRLVERFYTDLANLPGKSKLFPKNSKTLFSEFHPECRKHRDAKSKFLLKKEKEENDNKKEISEIVDVLVDHHARDDAATSALMHKSMFLGSRIVCSGARCVVSEEKREFDIRQYVVTMAGSAVTKVRDEDLVAFTPVEGAVSVTTAPNDKLPQGAHRTWFSDPSRGKKLEVLNHRQEEDRL